MIYQSRPVAFVLAATDHGMMIVHRMDWDHSKDAGFSIGVGAQLFERSHYEPDQVRMLGRLAELRREHHGDGVTVIDAGANVGAFTIHLARLMTGWGQVLAIEAQERIFYALAGNVALNNCLNVQALFAAVGPHRGLVNAPLVDYTQHRNFGGVSLGGEGQAVPMVDIDSMGMPRVDVIKLDVEGMELEALQGAQDTLKRFRPALFVEHTNVGRGALHDLLVPLGYFMAADSEMDVLYIHHDDPIKSSLDRLAS